VSVSVAFTAVRTAGSDPMVIVVTADATSHSVQAAQQAGARAFLGKPMQIAQAVKEIDAALSNP